jgi:hypothetical protein
MQLLVLKSSNNNSGVTVVVVGYGFDAPYSGALPVGCNPTMAAALESQTVAAQHNTARQ